jgi:hypothetical protein
MEARPRLLAKEDANREKERLRAVRYQQNLDSGLDLTKANKKARLMLSEDLFDEELNQRLLEGGTRRSRSRRRSQRRKSRIPIPEKELKRMEGAWAHLPFTNTVTYLGHVKPAEEWISRNEKIYTKFLELLFEKHKDVPASEMCDMLRAEKTMSKQVHKMIDVLLTKQKALLQDQYEYLDDTKRYWGAKDVKGKMKTMKKAIRRITHDYNRVKSIQECLISRRKSQF